jgi:hypothetical protein
MRICSGKASVDYVAFRGFEVLLTDRSRVAHFSGGAL